MSIYRLLAAGAAAAVLAGCTSSSSPIPSSVGGSPPPASSGAPAATSSPAHHHRHHHHQAQAAGCDAALWAHVYHPDRLHVIRQCMTVRGTVTEVRWEPDGDLHIRLATRPALVNAVNDQYQAGDLVLEEICQGQVSQADAGRLPECATQPGRPGCG